MVHQLIPNFTHFRQFVDCGKDINKETKVNSISYFKLFRFATRCEIFLLYIGLIFAALASMGVPYGLILYGEFTTTLVDRTIGDGTSTETVVLEWYGGGRVL